MSGGGKDAQVIGYKYYMGLHFGICLSPNSSPVDSIKRIDVGERVAWSGNATSNQQLYIDSPELFGGEEEEGGIQGKLDLHFGGISQDKNNYLEGLLGLIPAFRGVLSAVFERGYIAAFNPYVKPWRFIVKRCPKYWYPEKAEINGIANPAHILYDCIISREFGMSYPATSIDDATFRAVADTLHLEGFGLSFTYKGNGMSALEGFVKEILNHINGTFFVSQSTGLFGIKLLRDDYDFNTVDVFDEDNILSMDSFQRVAWGETTNEITVIYTDPVTFSDTSITVQDLANITIQGGIVAQTKTYRGIRSADIAYRVAMRDLTVMSSPLAKITITVNRDGWNKIVGDVLKLNWSDHGIVNKIYRILEIDYGLLNSGKIKLIITEDVFGLPDTSYAEEQGSLWVEPVSTPEDLEDWRIDEATYFQVFTKLTEPEIAELDPQFGFITMMSKRDNGLYLNYQIHSSSDNLDYKRTGTGFFNPTILASVEVDYLDTLIYYDINTNDEYIESGGLVYADNELMEIVSIDLANKTITVKRGVLDSIPQKHLVDSIFYFNQSGFDNTERVLNELTYLKLLPKSSSGVLDPALASNKTIVIAQRFQRPYPPANVKLNAEYYPEFIIGDILISWSHRDRTQQTVDYESWTTGSIGQEIGVTYTIKIYNDLQTLIHTVSGLSGDNYIYSEDQEIIDNGHQSTKLTFNIISTRDGLDSFSDFNYTAKREGVPINLDLDSSNLSLNHNLTDYVENWRNQ